MMLDRTGAARAAALLALLGAAAAAPAAVPAWLPRYDVVMDVDVAGHKVAVQMRATWTNPCPTPTDKLVFNAHSHYVVPDSQVGLMAKTLEILRVNPGEELGEKEPACEVHKVTLVGPASASGRREPADDVPFRYEGDTNTTLVVPLPRPVQPGRIRHRRPRRHDAPAAEAGPLGPVARRHLPEQLAAGLRLLRRSARPAPRRRRPTASGRPALAADAVHRLASAVLQRGRRLPRHRHRAGRPAVACTGTVASDTPLDDGRRRLDIHADGVRDFAFLCSAEYHEFATVLEPRVGVSHPIRIHVLALPQHEHYAKETLRIACDALTTYSKWFGPYPYDDFTVAESYFGWNGNECGMLVMIDERVFGMPHVAGGFVDYLISHETCHQWWYNVVGVNGYSETFMDEGLATYFSKRLMNQTCGPDSNMMTYPPGLEWLPNVRREDYHSYGMYGTIGRGENGPIIQDMDEVRPLINLFSMAYDKGSRSHGHDRGAHGRGRVSRLHARHLRPLPVPHPARGRLPPRAGGLHRLLVVRVLPRLALRPRPDRLGRGGRDRTAVAALL